MKRIWKYVLPLQSGEITHNIPADSILRFVGKNPQTADLAIWFEIKFADNPRITDIKLQRTFRIVGTGFEIAENEQYLGSVPDGEFIWHVFEVLAVKTVRA